MIKGHARRSRRQRPASARASSCWRWANISDYMRHSRHEAGPRSAWSHAPPASPPVRVGSLIEDPARLAQSMRDAKHEEEARPHPALGKSQSATSSLMRRRSCRRRLRTDPISSTRSLPHHPRATAKPVSLGVKPWDAKRPLEASKDAATATRARPSRFEEGSPRTRAPRG